MQAAPAGKTMAGQPATTSSIAANEARLTIETPPPAANHNAQQQPAQPVPVQRQAPATQAAAGPAGTATSTASRPGQQPAGPQTKLTGLAAMKEALAAKQVVQTVQEVIPMTLGAIHVYWEEFIDTFRQANKMTVVSNLQLAVINLAGPEEITIVSRNIVQFRFMEEEKLAISAFFKEKFRNPAIVLTLQLDESQQTMDIGPAPLSSREQFQKMTEKYPLVKELKDKLNMELDF
jgi:DNA polymerase III subunit gamma/tau